MIKLSHSTINKKLKQLFIEKNIQYCEIRLKKCTGSYGLTYHHRWKRRFYNNRQELLWDFNHVVLICCNCHIILENDLNKSKDAFEKLRPNFDCTINKKTLTS